MKHWTGNRKSMFVTLGASNHTDKERESNDFYATDPIAIDKLVKVIQLPRKIWECACGTGCLSDRLMDTCMKLLNLSCYIKMPYFTVALIGIMSAILSCV